MKISKCKIAILVFGFAAFSAFAAFSKETKPLIDEVEKPPKWATLLVKNNDETLVRSKFGVKSAAKLFWAESVADDLDFAKADVRLKVRTYAANAQTSNRVETLTALELVAEFSGECKRDGKTATYYLAVYSGRQ